MRFFLTCSFLLSLCIGPARAQTAYYALVVGNNAPPAGETKKPLPGLRYADDDAVRYHQFFQRLGADGRLLAVLDPDTQKRYPGLSEVAALPTLSNLLATVDEMAGRMAQDRRRGMTPVFYLVFSGHGAVDSAGQAYLALLDEGLSRRRLYNEVLGKLPAEYSHLIVDACHAGAVVGMRGVFDREREAERVAVSCDEALEVVGAGELARLPGLGVIVATASDQEAHEWSRIESGVFTHELLSGLGGAADVNADGAVEYTEIQAFVAAANRDVTDPRAAPRVLARPPGRNHNVALVRLDALSKVVFLRGDASRLGHFFIELAGGQRLLDAHLAGPYPATLALPAGTAAFVRTDTHEAEVRPFKTGEARLADLRFSRRRLDARGSIDAAYRAGLFASAFGVTYYRGFVDSIGAVGVRFDRLPPAVEAGLARPPAYRRPLAIASLGVAGASAVASIVTGLLAYQAKRDFDGTDLQRPAHEAGERYAAFGSAALACGILAAAAGVAAYLLWPDDEAGQPAVRPMIPGVGDPGLALSFSW